MNGWEDFVQPVLYTIDGANFSLLLFAAFLAALFGLICSLADGLQTWYRGQHGRDLRP